MSSNKENPEEGGGGGVPLTPKLKSSSSGSINSKIENPEEGGGGGVPLTPKLKSSSSSSESSKNKSKRNTKMKSNKTKKVSDIGIEKINVSEIIEIPSSYPTEFLEFAAQNGLKAPNINSSNGKALSVMLANPGKYWDRESADAFVAKFDIKTRDSIQLFNKHEQWGIKTGEIRGKNYIIFPYLTSNKHKMRKDFKFDGSVAEKNAEIEKIKSTIKTDYIDVPNDQWQLGHKNPESDDNKSSNLVLQPPIQAKYRDKYIFMDTLTKIPTPKTLVEDFKSDKSPYTIEQMRNLKKRLNEIADL